MIFFEKVEIPGKRLAFGIKSETRGEELEATGFFSTPFFVNETSTKKD